MALVPIIILSIFNYFRYTTFGLFQTFGKISLLFSKDDIINNTNLLNLKMVCCLIFGLLFFIIILYNIYMINSKNEKIEKRFLLPTIFLAGLASRLIIGFSPTVFASGNRTNLFFDFSIIIVIIILWQYMINKKILKDRKVLYLSIIILSLLNYTSILFKLIGVGI